MISRLSVVSILVRDQDEALRFYTEKLGLEKRTDINYGPGMRWLTVAPKGQKLPEIALARPDVRLHGAEYAQTLMNRIGQGTSWIFDTDNCYRTYETLCSRGVQFITPPTVQGYGIEAVFVDLYGNIFSLLEPSQEVQARLADSHHAPILLSVA